jgi:hypothetical protein
MMRCYFTLNETIEVPEETENDREILSWEFEDSDG